MLTQTTNLLEFCIVIFTWRDLNNICQKGIKFLPHTPNPFIFLTWLCKPVAHLKLRLLDLIIKRIHSLKYPRSMLLGWKVSGIKSILLEVKWISPIWNTNITGCRSTFEFPSRVNLSGPSLYGIARVKKADTQ